MTRAHQDAGAVRVCRIDGHVIPAEAWANGGGETRTLARGVDADGQTAWRVSLATLAGSARFSRFPGLDRAFVLIDQECVDLRVDPRSDAGALRARRGQPVRFSGDLDVWLHMRQAGPAHALNVMTRRGRTRAWVDAFSRGARIQAAAMHLLVNLAGAWRVTSAALGDAVLAPWQALRLAGHAGTLELIPADTGVAPLMASIALEMVSAAP